MDGNRKFLDTEIKRLRSKIDELKKSLEQTNKPIIRYKTIENYSWDQTDGLVKIYLNIDNFKNPPTKEQIKVELQDNDRTAIILVDNIRVLIKNLHDEVSIDSDNLGRITKSFVIVNLKKKGAQKWPSLKKSAQTAGKPDAGPLGDLNADGLGQGKDDPSQSMMNLMKVSLRLYVLTQVLKD